MLEQSSLPIIDVMMSHHYDAFTNIKLEVLTLQ